MDLIRQTAATLRRKNSELASACCGILPLLFCMAFIWPFGGGGRAIHMMAGTSAPGAHGVVIAKKGNNGNTALDIKVSSLAAPGALTPPENVYVVWIQKPGQAPENHGQIQVNSGENGELHTETPYARFRVFITAEQNAQAQTPMGPQVLSADISRD